MEDQGEKQVTTIQNQGQIKTIGSNKGVDNESCKGFGELSHERISEIKNLSRKNDLNTLTYYFKNKSNPINFIGFQAPLHLYRDIFNGNIKLAKAEKDQKQFKSDLNEITRGNPNKKSADQIKIIENIKNVYNSRQKVINLFNDYTKIIFQTMYKTKQGIWFKISTPKQMLQRLPIAVIQVKPSSNSENLLNEIR